MGANNTIVIVSNNLETVSGITSKLVLLRDLDKVQDVSTANALTFLEENIPNVIILDGEKNSPHVLNLIKEIKKTNVINNIPILLIDDCCSREFLIDAFDNGISDLIHSPVSDYELLIRIIWCIKKNEQQINYESRNDFLAQLGIIRPKTGVYTQKYYEEYLTSRIDSVIKYREHACLMLVSPDSKYPTYKDPEIFLDTVKKSVRLNDSVAIADKDKYYVFLPKTKLNGVYAVFERLNSNLGLDSGANASVIEINNKPFSEIKDSLETALKKAMDNSNSLIVASDIFGEKIEESVTLNKETVLSTGQWIEAPEPTPCEERTEEEQRNAKLLRQAFRKKCNIVIEPVFEKYELHVQQKFPNSTVSQKVEFNQSEFVLSKKDVVSTLTIKYSGFSKVHIETLHTLGGEKQSGETLNLDIINLSFQKLSQLLEFLITQFGSLVRLNS